MFGIGLAWMLFEGGLRTDAILRILRKLAGTERADAVITAKTLLKRNTEYILVAREPRKPRGKAEVDPKISIVGN